MLDPFQQDDRWKVYLRFRNERPVLWSDHHRSFFVFGWPQVRAVLVDERFTVEHPFRTSRQVLGQTVLDTDGLAHHTHRERLRPLFSAKALAGYRTGILEPAATALLDRLCLEPSGDLMAKYARLFPARVILQMLGLPLASERAVLEMLRPIIRSIDGHPGVLARAERSRHALEAILRAAFRSGEVAGSPLATYVLAASGWDE